MEFTENYVLDQINKVVEFNEIRKDEKTFFNENGKFLHHKFAKYMIEKYHIKTNQDLLYIYQNGVYLQDDSLIKSKMIDEIDNIDKSQRAEVLDYIKLKSPVTEDLPLHLIPVNDGVFSLETKEVMPYSPEYFVTSKINADYRPEIYSDVIETYLRDIADGDEQIITLFKEVISYMLYRKNVLSRSFLLYGPKGTGKSAFIKMVTTFVGIENTASLSLKDISDDKFAPAQLNNKLLNAGDELPNVLIRDSSNFKKMSTGEAIYAQFKGVDGFYMRPYAKLLFSSNYMPRFRDTGGAITDRFIIVPMNVTFRHTDKEDIYLEDKLTSEESKSHLLNIAMEHLPKILKRKGFTYPDQSKDMMNEFEVENNPIMEFLEENEVDGIMTEEAHRDYRLWCEDAGYTPFARNRFTSAVKDRGYIIADRRHTINGRMTGNKKTFLKSD